MINAGIIAVQMLSPSEPPVPPECPPYTRPSATSLDTDLDGAITWRDSTPFETNLCSEII